MPLISDYAITPDVFDQASYTSEDAFRMNLGNLEKALVSGGIVRDLRSSEKPRSSEWRKNLKKYFEKETRSNGKSGSILESYGYRIIQKLESQARLIPYRPMRKRSPKNAIEWCEEALLTHEHEPFTGSIVVTKKTKEIYNSEDRVQSIELLSSKKRWWSALREPSVQLRRTKEDYREYLRPILRFANSFTFIDPYLDPQKPWYNDFIDLLIETAKERGAEDDSPKITIHRSYKGTGRNKGDLNLGTFKTNFIRKTKPIYRSGLEIEVFIWDKFHDRFLISNLVSANLSNGFDTGDGTVVWSRIGNQLRSTVESEFQENENVHELIDNFKLTRKGLVASGSH